MHFQPHGTPPVKIWDRIVAVSFCACLLLFLHALAGVGGERSLHTSGSPSQNEKLSRKGIVPEDCKFDSGTTIRHTASYYFPTVVATASLIPTSTISLPMTQEFHFRHPFYDKYEPFDGDPFFDADEYDNDGQPFALKIRVKDPIVFVHERCHASGGLRCRND